MNHTIQSPEPCAAPALFERVRQAPLTRREQIVADLAELQRQAGLGWALRALFRQQVACGYVLFDPADPAMLAEKRFVVPGDTAIALRLQWNPQRELRLNHALLIERGVFAKVAPERLVNRTDTGGCYLCPRNIALQSPAEILLPLTLNDEPYLLGANFAPITDNHFTVIPSAHRPQRYRRGLLRAGFELAEASGGTFRVLFNGRAGASILAHAHLHATDARLPVEDLTAAPLLFRQGDDLRVSRPDYPLPLWLVEGRDADAVIRAGDRLIRAWRRRDPARHSENLLMSVDAGRYRLFIVPRDRERLTAPERTAAMASFETAGLIVLSHPSERRLFETADAALVRQLLTALTPACPPEAALGPAMLGF